MSPTSEAELKSLIRGLLAEVQSINRHLAKPPARARSSADQQRLSSLLEAIDTGIQDRAFAIHDLLDVAASDRELGKALRKATGVSTRQGQALGHLLKRASRCDLPWFTIEKVGEARDGAIWMVKAKKAGL